MGQPPFIRFLHSKKDQDPKAMATLGGSKLRSRWMARWPSILGWGCAHNAVLDRKKFRIFFPTICTRSLPVFWKKHAMKHVFLLRNVCDFLSTSIPPFNWPSGVQVGFLLDPQRDLRLWPPPQIDPSNSHIGPPAMSYGRRNSKKKSDLCFTLFH